MPASRLQSCCFCIQMELGLKILGILEAIGGVIGLLLAILAITGTIMDSGSETRVTMKESIHFLIECILNLLAAGFLLHGVFRRQTNSLKWSLSIRYILIIGTIIGIILMFFDKFNGEVLGSAIVYILISGYFCWVIHSYRADLIDSKVSTTAA